MCMKIIFSIEYNNLIPNGTTKITKDQSILFDPPVAIDSFSIYPYHWSFELTTKKLTEKQYLLRFAMGSLCLLNYTSAKLTIPKSKRGRIYVSFSSPPCTDGIYYNEFSKFQKKKYYDTKNKTLAVGNISISYGICVEFASGQFAVIDKSGDLVAIYVRID